MTNSLRRSSVTGSFVKKPDRHSSGDYHEVAPGKVLPKSAASDEPATAKVSKGSGRVIKEVSADHKEALRRLVDR